MTTTGPMPAVAQATSSAERMAALVMRGAPFTGGIWRAYPTADAMIDTGRGVLWIAVDAECDPSDWAAITGLIKLVGYDNGCWPHTSDPGEPEFRDALSGVVMWRLEYVLS